MSPWYGVVIWHFQNLWCPPRCHSRSYRIGHPLREYYKWTPTLAVSDFLAQLESINCEPRSGYRLIFCVLMLQDVYSPPVYGNTPYGFTTDVLESNFRRSGFALNNLKSIGLHQSQRLWIHQCREQSKVCNCRTLRLSPDPDCCPLHFFFLTFQLHQGLQTEPSCVMPRFEFCIFSSTR